MKKVNIMITAMGLITALSACKVGNLNLQKDATYTYGSQLHPEINKTARQYLLDRGKAPVTANDTVFKYMQLGLEYAGMDMTEYAKDARTFIFLSNNAIRVLPTTSAVVAGKTVITTTSNVPTAGMWFDFPIMDKNPDGTQKFAADGITPVTHPAKAWSDYSPATVKAYFLGLIGQGVVGFGDLNNVNTGIVSILPVGTVASKESKIGYLVSSTTPNLSVTGSRIITYNFVTGGSGFDPESKFNLKMVNSDFTPMMLNDNTTIATGGLVATNGQIHVSATTVYPCRY